MSERMISAYVIIGAIVGIIFSNGIRLDDCELSTKTKMVVTLLTTALWLPMGAFIIAVIIILSPILAMVIMEQK